MVGDANDENWSPIPLKNVIQGHLTTGTLLIPGYLLACWLCGRILSAAAMPFGVLSAVVIVSALVSAVPNGFILHMCSVRQRTDYPKPWFLVPQALCLALIMAVAVMMAVGAPIPAVATGLVMGTVSLAVNVFMLPKNKDELLTRAQVAENIEKTRAMTREVFTDELAHVHKEQQRKLDEVNKRHGIDSLHGR